MAEFLVILEHSKRFDTLYGSVSMDDLNDIPVALRIFVCKAAKNSSQSYTINPDSITRGEHGDGRTLHQHPTICQVSWTIATSISPITVAGDSVRPSRFVLDAEQHHLAAKSSASVQWHQASPVLP